MRAALVATLLLLIPGCITDLGDEATLSHEGDGSPYHGQASAPCGDTSVLGYTINVRAGALRLRVIDAEGSERFNETFVAPDGGMIERSLLGAPGAWTLEAVGSGFEGRLHATLTC